MKQVQYRNCNYIGGFEDYQRQGYGMLLFDNSNVLIAKWKQSMIDGPYSYITDRVHAFGTIINGKLQGFNAISLKQTPIKGKNLKKAVKNQTLFCMFRDNRPYGKFVLVCDDQVTLGQYVQGQISQIQQRQNQETVIVQVLKRSFPNQPYQIQNFTSQIMAEAKKQIQSLQGYKYVPIVQYCDNDIIFYGYFEAMRPNKKLGVTMSNKGQLLTIGQHDQIYLQGLGRAYKNQIVQDGVFKGGILNGIGVKYYSGPHRYQLGQYGRGQAIQKGFGFPMKEISDIRKQFHLRSIQFYNDIVVLSIGTLFQALIENTLMLISHRQQSKYAEFRQDNHRKKSRIGEKSPIKSRLQKYQYETDQIQDSSPIRQPLNSYSRVEIPNEGMYSRASRKSPSQYGQRQMNSRNRKYSRQRLRDNDERSTRSGKKIKDTKNLVKQLDQRQKHKRNSYLDQIYKDAKLYKK